MAGVAMRTGWGWLLMMQELRIADGGKDCAYQGGMESLVDWISKNRESMSLWLSRSVLPPSFSSIFLLLINSPVIFTIGEAEGCRYIAIHGFLFHHSSNQGI